MSTNLPQIDKLTNDIHSDDRRAISSVQTARRSTTVANYINSETAAELNVHYFASVAVILNLPDLATCEVGDYVLFTQLKGGETSTVQYGTETELITSSTKASLQARFEIALDDNGDKKWRRVYVGGLIGGENSIVIGQGSGSGSTEVNMTILSGAWVSFETWNFSSLSATPSPKIAFLNGILLGQNDSSWNGLQLVVPGSDNNDIVELLTTTT